MLIFKLIDNIVKRILLRSNWQSRSRIGCRNIALQKKVYIFNFCIFVTKSSSRSISKIGSGMRHCVRSGMPQ